MTIKGSLYWSIPMLKRFSAAKKSVQSKQSCAPSNWWSAAALGGLMTGGGGAPRIFHRRRRRGFMVGGGGVGGVRPDERTLKQRTRRTGVFSLFYRCQPLHLWYPLGCWRRKVNCEYACFARFHCRNELIVYCLISGGSYKCKLSVEGTLMTRE